MATTPCPACGGPLVDGNCSACESGHRRLVHREILWLGIVCAIAVAAFVLTRAAAAANRGMHARDAATLYQLGQHQLAAGRAAEAVAALQRAAIIDRTRPQYRLALARALMKTGQYDGAGRVLLALREQAPDDPEINAQLARVQARTGDVTAAVRYYRNALYGVWADTATAERRRLRLELSEYLLTHRQTARAVAELTELASDAPATAAAHVEIARLFQRAGDDARALGEFQRALRLVPQDTAAMAGAGRAAFSAGDYARAATYLSGVGAGDRTLAQLREIASLVLANDPLQPRLHGIERQRRLIADVRRALLRLQGCTAAIPDGPGTPAELVQALAETQTFAAGLHGQATAASPEIVDSGVDIVYSAESAASRNSCNETQPLDSALILIGRSHGAGR
jgi:tetratricopeptide (TPR) repeat protein